MIIDMRIRGRRLFTVFAAVMALCATRVSAQAPSLKRTAEGTPNLSGTWQTGGVSLYGEPGSRRAPPPPVNAAPRPEPPAYQAWAEEKRKQLTAVDDPIAHCFLPGVPRIITMPMPFEIVQTPGKIVILYEAFRGYRIIPIDDRLRHPDDLVPTWMGDSVGRWDGDTLLVDVVGFNDKTWLTGAVPEMWLFFLGALFIVVTLALPHGIVGLARAEARAHLARWTRILAPGITRLITRA